jgi:selenide,water dikinase
MARGAGVTIEIDAESPALLPGVEAFLRAGVRTGASTRNWDSYGRDVRGADALSAWRRDLLTDPQTSGGLLIAVAEERAEEALMLAQRRGFAASRIVGRVRAGEPRVEVR